MNQTTDESVQVEEAVNQEDAEAQVVQGQILNSALFQEKMQENAELLERLKRLQADFDNFRRRSRQEKEDLSGTVSEGLLVQLLPIMDNFERALDDNSCQDPASLLTGIKMIHRQLVDTLEKMGLEKIQAVGNSFDPQWHEAVMTESKSDCEEGIVLEEFQKGYVYKGKVIRPSMVKVTGN